MVRSVTNFEITVDVREEAGCQWALEGISYNKDQPISNMPRVADKLKDLDGGHNKFLEHIYIWVVVKAPRYWWQEADTYRHASKNSESTMHTIFNNALTVHNFECGNIHPEALLHCNRLLETGNHSLLKRYLPEGFLQKRMWVFNYKTLRGMIINRKNHRLPHWPYFITEMYKQLENPELLPFPDYCKTRDE